MSSQKLPSASERLEMKRWAEELRANQCYLFFKVNRHFCNPLVAQEWQALKDQPLLRDAAVRAVVEDQLVGALPQLEPGIYSPVPIARALERGDPLESALATFRYEPIQVDDQQQWWWQGRPVAPRLRRFFTEHLVFVTELGLWAFEYRVNDDWFDKSYVLGAMTPVLAHRAEWTHDPFALEVYLNTGRSDLIDPTTLRFDARERLLGMSALHGEVLLSETVKFQLLKHLTEQDGALILVVGSRSLEIATSALEP